jgi:hypothetical protein
LHESPIARATREDDSLSALNAEQKAKLSMKKIATPESLILNKKYRD